MNGPLGAILYLKWRLALNQSSSAAALGAVLLFIMGLLVATGAVCIGVAMFWFMRSHFFQREPLALLGILDALLFAALFFWAMGILMELQRSEPIDFRKMLHFPVSPRSVFFFNYLASAFTAMFAVYAAAMIGLIAGLAQSADLPVLPAAALAVLFYNMIAAWLYFFRGWLTGLVAGGKRRKQMIVSIITIVFVLLCQVPQLLINSSSPDRLRGIEPLLEAWLPFANKLFPPAWLPYGLWSLAGLNYANAAWCALGLAVLGALGLSLGYRNTLRYYMGNGGGFALGGPARSKQDTRPARSPWTLCHIPLLGHENSGLTFAFLLSFLRHPFLRITMFNLLVGGVVFGVLLTRPLREFHLLSSFRSGVYFILPWVFLNVMPFMQNVFGFDAQAFRRLVLLPVSRWRYLFAANAALFMVIAVPAGVMVAGFTFFFRTPLADLAITALYLPTGFLLLSLVGNLFSIFFPTRIEFAAMRKQVYRLRFLLLNMVSMAFVSLSAVPLMCCAALNHWAGTPFPAGVALAFGLLAVTGAIYTFTLTPMGDLLLSREHRMGEVLSRHTE